MSGFSGLSGSKSTQSIEFRSGGFDRGIREALDELDAKSLLREVHTIDAVDGPTIVRDGRTLINFASNDYLGLSQHESVREAAKRAIDVYGVGAGASRLITGSQRLHERCESALACFKGAEAALMFASGYAAAVGTITSLTGDRDVIFLDKLAHASLIDGAKLSGAIIRVFPHNNLERLEEQLVWAEMKHPAGRRLVVTESVFSMDGDRCDLQRLVEIKNKHRAFLLLDEAHATGVIGPFGKGLAALLGLEREVDIQMGTLSKALGVSGGFIAGSRDLIDLLINRARSFIYSTALPAAIAAAAEAAVHLLSSEEGERLIANLWINIQSVAHGLAEIKGEPSSAIIPIIVSDEQRALNRSAHLLAHGFLIPAIRFPTVAKGSARLRIAVSALHTREQIECLIHALQQENASSDTG
jgi:glycine C-acetyltransferase/8-amino-7-oxononanoate synthase